MKFRILHSSRGRLRVHAETAHMDPAQADILEYYLRETEGVQKAVVHERTGNAEIQYRGSRETLLSALAHFRYEGNEGLVPAHTGRALSHTYEDALALRIEGRILEKLLLPYSFRAALALFRSLGFLKKGLDILRRGRLEVPVLDAAAIGASLCRQDFSTASSVMFLLGIGELLEEWTHKKSVDDLARTMSLNIDRVWAIRDGEEQLLPVGEIAVGDTVIVRMGSMIPLDGTVLSGEAMVNQASMTGEAVPVRKTAGSYVYAGTVVEEGGCRIRIEKAAGEGRYDRIVEMIETSEKLKSETEDKASHLADKLVPISLGGTAIVFLLTRDIPKALSFLMVDFSCALKLSMPIAVLSAMQEAGQERIAVKGGKFLEAVAEAETVVFDKTGTLTNACPRVAEIIPFGGTDEQEALRMAACLEEHYPHSIANAVVEEARARGLLHAERHSKVIYVVAHGISSIYEGKKVDIGSYHFVFEDEGCKIPEGAEERFQNLPAHYSHLYMAVEGVLSAVICISDPVREEAAEVIRLLREQGFSRIVMMTGDNEQTAKAIAAEIGVDEYRAGVLPEEKAAFIRSEHAAGRKVLMVGDGVNDSPALSEADAGIAISDGAAIAREVADITISADNLYTLVRLRELSTSLMTRINGNYRFIMGFNFFLILMGVMGALPPATSALLHNVSTIGIGLRSMTKLGRLERKGGAAAHANG